MANRVKRANARNYLVRLGITEKKYAPEPIHQVAVARMERAAEWAPPKTSKKITDGLAAMKRIQRKPDSRELEEIGLLDERAEELVRSMMEDVLREITPEKMAKRYEDTNRRFRHDNPSDPSLMAFRHEVMLAGMEGDARSAAQGMAFREFVKKVGAVDADRLIHTQYICGRWLLGFAYNAESAKELAVDELVAQARRQLTKNAREAARAQRLTTPDGKMWPEVAQKYAAGDDPGTGKPWRTKKRMYAWIGEKLKKDPETVRRVLGARKRT